MPQTANSFKVKVDINYFVWVVICCDRLRMGPKAPPVENHRSIPGQFTTTTKYRASE